MKLPAILLVFLVSVRCGSPEAPEAAGDTPAPAAAESAGSAARSDGLTEIPEACDLLTSDDAATILGGPAVRYEPRVECAYLEEGVGKATSKQISAAVYCPAVQGRHYEGLSQDELVERLRTDMLGGELQKTDSTIGRGALVFTQNGGVVVFALSGISYSDPRGGGGELAIQTTAMKFPAGNEGVDAALAAARVLTDKLARGR